jgi:hypothetical protein
MRNAAQWPSKNTLRRLGYSASLVTEPTVTVLPGAAGPGATAAGLRRPGTGVTASEPDPTVRWSPGPPAREYAAGDGATSWRPRQVEELLAGGSWQLPAPSLGQTRAQQAPVIMMEQLPGGVHVTAALSDAQHPPMLTGWPLAWVTAFRRDSLVAKV